MSSPLDTTRVSLEDDHVLASLGVLEPQDTTVSTDKHHSCSRFDLFAREITNSSFRHISSPCIQFTGFSASILEHQNVAHSNWTQNVA